MNLTHPDCRELSSLLVKQRVNVKIILKQPHLYM